MKNYAPLFIVMAGVFSISGFAQRNARTSSQLKVENEQLMASNMTAEDGLAVVSYHVEERINMNFGSRTTTYEVSSLSLVDTNDLGENNVRLITPKFAKVKTTAIAIPVEQPKAAPAPIAVIIAPVKEVHVEERKTSYVNIDILATYERVLDKGYQTVEMLQRVGNARFFDGDLVMAAKWYSQLFKLKTDLEPVLYYRYAQSLKAIGQNQKADEMMLVFEKKSK